MRISHSKLYQTAKDLSVTIERDMADFQQAGITAEMFENFKTDTDKVMTNFDQTYLFDKMELTSEKDELEKKLRQALRKVFLIQVRAYKFSNGRMGSGLQAISNYKPHELVGAGIEATDLMTIKLDKFASYNITQADIDELRKLILAFSFKRTQITAAINKRNLATKERNEAAEKVYSNLVFFAQMGKTIYSGINEAKYNDYILGLSNATKTHVGKTESEPEQIPPDDDGNTKTAMATAPDDMLELKERDFSNF